MSERTIFFEALEIADPAERAAYVDRACAGDAQLRKEVESLLAAHGREGDFLDVPAVEQAAAARPGGRTEATGAFPVGDPAATRQQPPDPEVLSFLAPSQRAGSLGRLDHYEVLEVVGKGGMGVVFRAYDVKLHRVVALKAMAAALASGATARQRFVREARAAAAVVHEHVIDVHAVEDAGTVPYLVMQFIDGQSLDDKIQSKGPLELREVLRIGMQIASGLAAAHAQGLVHRDVKPANILLENSVERVKITDFGLARAADDASLTQSGVVAGTPMYMSPEQARGEGVDHRSDLFSLGSVLYASCTGRPPFRAENTMAVLRRVCEDTPRPIREVNPDVPDWLAAIVAKLHAKDSAQRFQSAAGVAELLGQHLAHLQQPSLVPRPAAAELPARPTQRPAPILAAAAAVLVAAGALAAYLILRPDRPEVVPDGGSPKGEQRADPFVPPRPLTLDELAKAPSPFDGRNRADVPPEMLALAGSGHPEQAPPELVAVLGDARFRLPDPSLGSGWMAQSADGQVLGVPSGADVVLFDAPTGKYLRTLPGQTGRAFRVTFSPDGKHLAGAVHHADNPVKVWEVSTGRLLCALVGHNSSPWAVAFSPDGTRLASAALDKTVRVWDWSAAKEVHTLEHPGWALSVVFSPDGKQIVSGGGDKTVRVWDAHTGKETHSLTGHAGPQISGLAFSPDGKRLASGTVRREIKLWDARTFEEVGALKPPGTWLAFTPDSQTLLAGATDHTTGSVHTVTRWDVAAGKEVARPPLNSQGDYVTYCLSPDGKTLFALRCSPAPVDPFVRAYDADTGKELFSPRGHQGWVSAVAFSPDGRTLASAGADRTVRLWDLGGWRAGEPLPPARTLVRHTEPVLSVAFSPDGKMLASGSTDSTIVLWDVASGKEVRTLSGHSRWSAKLAFSPDGQTVAAGAEDGRVKFSGR